MLGGIPPPFGFRGNPERSPHVPQSPPKSLKQFSKIQKSAQTFHLGISPVRHLGLVPQTMKKEFKNPAQTKTQE